MFHCDEYYINTACEYIGKRDVMDKREHRTCMSEGRNDKGRFCPHCMENKGLFRRPRRRLSTRCRIIKSD